MVRTHEFEISVTGTITDEAANRLYEAGCDDASPEPGPSDSRLVFDREAATFIDAALSAPQDIKAAGLEPIRVEPDELVTTSDIAERTGRTRQSVDQLTRGNRGPGGFPAPVHRSGRVTLWHWSDVVDWFTEYEEYDNSYQQERALATAAINGALDTHRRVAHLQGRDRTRVPPGTDDETTTTRATSTAPCWSAQRFDRAIRWPLRGHSGRRFPVCVRLCKK